MRTIRILSAVFIVALIASCTAPRSITQSGKVVPHKYMRVGGDYLINASTIPVNSTYKQIKNVVVDLANKDSIMLGPELLDASKVAVAYALDPILTGYDIYIRYGLLKRVDIGYKNSGNAHVFDTRFQFLGPLGNYKEPEEGSRFYGSIGVQFSQQSFSVPIKYLNILQKVLGFTFNRKDLMLPLVFSKSFGKEEKIGCFSFGAVYSHTFIDYKFDPKNVYHKFANNPPEFLPSVHEKKNFGAVGVFTNFKLGYKWVFAMPGLAVYYQDYGTYKLLGGDAHFKGVTIVPSIGVQFNFPSPKAKKEKSD